MEAGNAGRRNEGTAQDFICGGCARILPFAVARIRFDLIGEDGRARFQVEELPGYRWRFVSGFWCAECVDKPLPIHLLTDATLKKWHDEAQRGEGGWVELRSRIQLLCQELSRERAAREKRQVRDIG